jgi:hypothetical protein
VEVDDGFPFPRLQPEISGYPTVVLIHSSIALPPVRDTINWSSRSALPSAPAHPAYIQPIVIHDQDNDFPDGNYELMVGEQIFRFVKRNTVRTSAFRTEPLDDFVARVQRSPSKKSGWFLLSSFEGRSFAS